MRAAIRSARHCHFHFSQLELYKFPASRVQWCTPENRVRFEGLTPLGLFD